jgi:hypothetical protein
MFGTGGKIVTRVTIINVNLWKSVTTGAELLRGWGKMIHETT